jgi:hypothetical protein
MNAANVTAANPSPGRRRILNILITGKLLHELSNTNKSPYPDTIVRESEREREGRR